VTLRAFVADEAFRPFFRGFEAAAADVYVATQTAPDTASLKVTLATAAVLLLLAAVWLYSGVVQGFCGEIVLHVYI
jgi:hypothetical protein